MTREENNSEYNITVRGKRYKELSSAEMPIRWPFIKDAKNRDYMIVGQFKPVGECDLDFASSDEVLVAVDRSDGVGECIVCLHEGKFLESLSRPLDRNQIIDITEHVVSVAELL